MPKKKKKKKKWWGGEEEGKEISGKTEVLPRTKQREGKELYI